MRCARCREDNREGRRFCSKCGAALALACPGCGFVNEPGDAFCGGCARALSDALAGPSPSASAPGSVAAAAVPVPAPPSPRSAAAAGDGHRRQVTILFADMKGYTPMAERLGEEAIYELMGRVYELMTAVVHRHEGTVQELTGDGILALFGAPVALEDAPLKACRAALEIQERMEVLGAEIERERGVRPRARIGINTGPVVVGTVGGDSRAEFKAVGDTVNLAARLEGLAEPGSVLLSEATRRLVESSTAATSLGERDIKGKAEPQRVYRLERIEAHATRFESALRRGLVPLVGRREELETLMACWREAGAGALRLAHIVGEPGIGKSRLVHELRRRLEDEAALVLEGHCTADGAAASLLPFIEIARGVFRITDADGHEAARRKLRQGLELLGIPVEAARPYLATLLGLPDVEPALAGLDGEIIGLRTREALLRVLRERSRLGRCAVVVDDLHWLDRASESLLVEVTGSGEALPLLVVCTHRPGYRAPWAGTAAVTEIHLGPLSRDGTEQLVRQRLGESRASEDALRIVLEAAEGNPLFAEEMTRYLLETGAAAGDRAVPATLEAMVLARVDRLPERHRALLEAAAVVGRRFSVEVVGAVASLDGQRQQVLEDLERQEIIFRGGADGSADYAFKHVLLQESIYRSLLTPRRVDLHRRVAEAIEGLQGQRVGDWVEALAHHFSHTAETAKAVRYLTLAGEKSLRLFALDEADARFRRAVELIEASPHAVDDAALAGALLGWVRVHYYRKDFRAIVTLVERYLPRIESLGQARGHALLLFWLGFCHAIALRVDQGIPLLERALGLGEALGDEECIGYACMGLTYAYLGRGGREERQTVERLARRALDIARRRGDVYLGGKATNALAMDRMLRGHTAPARAAAEQTIDLGRAAGDPRTVAFGLAAIAFVHGLCERYEEALDAADEALRLSPDPLDRLTARAARGFTLALMRRGEEALGVLAEVRPEVIECEFLDLLMGVDLVYPVALALTGEPGRAVRWMEESLARFAPLRCDASIAMGHLILGEIYLEMVRGDVKTSAGMVIRNLGFLAAAWPMAARRARGELETALRIARDADMPFVLARGLLDLALLDAARKRPAEARAALAEALPIAETLDAAPLLERIRQTLASLP